MPGGHDEEPAGAGGQTGPVQAVGEGAEGLGPVTALAADRQQVVVHVAAGQQAEHRGAQRGPDVVGRPDPGVEGGAQPGQQDAEGQSAGQSEREQGRPAGHRGPAGRLAAADDVAPLGVAGVDVDDALVQGVQLALQGLGGVVLRVLLLSRLHRLDLLLHAAGGPLDGGFVTGLAVGQVGLGEGVGATRRAPRGAGGELEAQHLGLRLVGDPQIVLQRGGLAGGLAHEACRADGDRGAGGDLLLGAHADLVVGGHADRAEGVGGGAYEDFAGGGVGVGAGEGQGGAAEQSQDDSEGDDDAVTQEPAQLVA